MARILYQGHASFRLETANGATIYIDPFAPVGLDKPANLILITHEHFDHNCVDIVPQAEDCAIVRPVDVLRNGRYAQIEGFGISIEAVPACNANHPIDQCVGYLIYVDGVQLYFAGDTSKVDFMENDLAKRVIDYAFLPCDGVYNMDRPEAEECARIIGARHTVPIHTSPTGSPEQIGFDLEKAEAFEADGKIVMIPGETYDL